MKKMTVLATLIFFASAAAFAQAGTADIDPKAIAVGAYKPVIKISYKPAAATAMSGGSAAIIVPAGFSPPPATLNANLTAAVMAGNVTVAVVDSINIAIDGYAVTINALTLSAGEELVVVYGNTGAGGIYPPMTPGKYIFEVMEKTSGTSAFEALDRQPYLYITNVIMDKSSASTVVRAGDTVTYYLTFRNLDAGYPVSMVTTWDTLPEGMEYLASSPPATSVTGSYLRWDVGNVLAAFSTSITVTARALGGIINHGDKCVNSASISAMHPISGRNDMEAKKELPVQGVKLETSFAVFPDNVHTYQDITLVMGITNAGNMMAVMVSGTAQVISDGGSAALYTSPSPAYASGLAMGQSAFFTWIYKGTGAGSIHFSGHARAMENTFTVTSIQAGTNHVNITEPTPTFTPAVPVETFTQVVTSVATPVVTPAPGEPLPDKVRTDKNYINLTNGDQVEIKYTVESYGKSYIRIYNLSGEEIRGFYEFTLEPGTHTAYWDGTNTAGKKVGKGMYFIAVTQPGGRTIKKIIITK